MLTVAELRELSDDQFQQMVDDDILKADALIAETDCALADIPTSESDLGDGSVGADEASEVEEVEKGGNKSQGSLKIRLPAWHMSSEDAVSQNSGEKGAQKRMADTTEVNPPKYRKKAREDKSTDKEAKRARGRPRKDANSSGESEFSASIFVEVARDPTFIKGKMRKGDRTVSQPPHRFGPFTVTDKTTWPVFLTMMAESAHTTVGNMLLSTMIWRWNKEGKGSIGLPLTSQNGFETMGKQILASKERNSALILVAMAAPKSSNQGDLPPWARSDGVQCSIDDGDQSTPVTVSKKVSLDEQLQPIIEKLEEKYPVGACYIHPLLRCYHYHARDWHFELDHNRLSVWAHAILRCDVDYDRLPLTSEFFKADQVIRSKVGPMSHDYNTHSTTPVWPESSMPAPGYHSMIAGHGYPPHAYSHLATLSPYMNHASPYLNQFPPHSTRDYLSVPGPSQTCLQSPGSSPPPAQCDIEEWCSQFGLGEAELTGLRKLGFQVGDKLDDASVPPQMWKDAGFLPLEWNRVREADRKWRKKAKQRL